MSLKIGLVGCGNWGRHILRDLKALGAVVCVVARSDQSRANAAHHSADEIVADATDLAADCDGFVVATPTDTHLASIHAVLPHARPIFVEKPLSDNLDGVRALPASAHPLLFTMQKWRYHPAVEEMARIAAAQEFGPVRGLRSRRVQWGMPHDDTTTGWILAPHDVSIAMHVFGAVPTPVRAIGDPMERPATAFVAEMKDERTGAPIVIEVSAHYPSATREIALACEKAAIFLSDDDYTKLLIRPWPHLGGAEEARDVGQGMPLYRELEAFVQYLSGGPAPMTCFEEELKIIETITELHRLARAG